MVIIYWKFIEKQSLQKTTSNTDYDQISRLAELATPELPSKAQVCILWCNKFSPKTQMYVYDAKEFPPQA